MNLQALAEQAADFVQTYKSYNRHRRQSRLTRSDRLLWLKDLDALISGTSIKLLNTLFGLVCCKQQPMELLCNCFSPDEVLTERACIIHGCTTNYGCQCPSERLYSYRAGIFGEPKEGEGRNGPGDVPCSSGGGHQDIICLRAVLQRSSNDVLHQNRSHQIPSV